MSAEWVGELRRDLAALPDGMHHAHWSGNTDSPGNMELSAWVPGWGRASLIRPTRWGMQGARFQFLDFDTVMMVDADRLVKYEVGNRSVTGVHRRDGSVYRADVVGIDHPVARIITAALNHAPELLDSLEAVARVRALHRPAYNDTARSPICEECGGRAGVHPCGCWADDDYEFVCAVCNEGHKGQSVPWPCPTIAALDGLGAWSPHDAPPHTCAAPTLPDVHGESVIEL